MKLQVIKNNPSREGRDLADIELLLSVHKEIDWHLVEKYCKILEMDELYKKLRNRGW